MLTSFLADFYKVHEPNLIEFIIDLGFTFKVHTRISLHVGNIPSNKSNDERERRWGQHLVTKMEEFFSESTSINLQIKDQVSYNGSYNADNIWCIWHGYRVNAKTKLQSLFEELMNLEKVEVVIGCSKD